MAWLRCRRERGRGRGRDDDERDDAAFDVADVTQCEVVAEDATHVDKDGINEAIETGVVCGLSGQHSSVCEEQLEGLDGCCFVSFNTPREALGCL